MLLHADILELAQSFSQRITIQKQAVGWEKHFFILPKAIIQWASELEQVTAVLTPFQDLEKDGRKD